MIEGEVLWTPSPDVVARSKLVAFTSWLESEHGRRFEDYDELWQWSVADLEGFWGAVAEYGAIRFQDPPDRVLVSSAMPGAEWFPGATVNWAENVLARAPSDLAVLGRSQTRGPSDLTGEELSAGVASVRAGLLDLGVGRGDRVAAYLPNIPEALILLLATASIGAVFTSVPPEFGVKAVLDRLQQVDPVVLVAVDGYRHKGRPVDRLAEVEEIAAGLPSLRHQVLLPYLDTGAVRRNTLLWSQLATGSAELAFEGVPMDHPLYVLYTSGTSGLPKPIVHGHGGILLEHVKAHVLHGDLGPGDRAFWYSTTGWVMWNYLVSALLAGSSIVLFDGDVAYPDLDVLWRLAEETEVTSFGCGAALLLACRRAGIRPGADHDLSRVRIVGSTGSPLTAEVARWVYDEVGADLALMSISGGTDVASAFVGGTVTLPVRAGEITCRCLGVKAEAFDPGGRPVVDVQGELVISAPMPSMPARFWGDDDGTRYRAAYFERFPGVWAHGDWVTFTARGSAVISGRSDATLNRGGVRLGTSDFYSVVEEVRHVADSLVVHLEDTEGGAGELVLFVQIDGGGRSEDVVAEINRALLHQLSPRHVPDTVLVVDEIPRTLSGKKLEIPVKRILQGARAVDVANPDTLVNPSALTRFELLAAMR